jgi:hypothetical protein
MSGTDVFNELVQDVFTITNRPDLLAETETAVKSATLKAHHLDFFSKDLHEEGIQFPEPGYRQNFDYINAVDNFRQFKYARKAEDPCDDCGKFFTIITPEEVLDSYGVCRTDIAYVAGRVLEMKSSTEFQYFLLGCYVHPIVRTGAYCSWVALQYPNAIVYEAARVVFKAIGKADESQQYTALTGEEYEILKLSNIQDIGY